MAVTIMCKNKLDDSIDYNGRIKGNIYQFSCFSHVFESDKQLNQLRALPIYGLCITLFVKTGPIYVCNQLAKHVDCSQLCAQQCIEQKFGKFDKSYQMAKLYSPKILQFSYYMLSVYQHFAKLIFTFLLNFSLTKLLSYTVYL